MDKLHNCPECGAIWTNGTTCKEYFHKMGAWELENPSFVFEVHHLMVLSYHLQHPGLYSPEGLTSAKQLLVDFLEHGFTPVEVRRRHHAELAAGKRRFKVTGSPDWHGAYDHPVHWTMTVADVTAGGVDHYCDNVTAWARSILEVLRASGNL